jgi:biopolymer transport protein ExbB
MNKCLGFFLLLVAAVFSQQSLAAWNADWPHRSKVALNTAEAGVAISTAVEAVPVLVRLHTGNFTFADAKVDGSDIRFIAADDKTPLKYHIEKFDAVNELAFIWVQLPKLLPNSKSDFVWLYYGNANAPAGDDAKASYDTAQTVVYHFGEKDGQAKDATAYVNNGSASGVTASASGLAAGGVTFDGKAKITVPASSSIKLGSAGMTVSMWIKPADLTGAVTLFSQQEGANGIRLGLNGGKLVAQMTGAASASTQSSAALTAAAWHHVALVVKDGFTIYLDGVEAAKLAAPNAAIAGEVTIGQGYKGELDEFELAYAARSADWVRTAALSQGQDQKLITYGEAEAEEKSTSYFKVLLGSVTVDGWVVIGLLAVMFCISTFVMITKMIFVNNMVASNERFKHLFARLTQDMTALDLHGAQAETKEAAKKKGQGEYASSSLYRIYHVGVSELKHRFDIYKQKGRELILTPQSIDAIRASLDAGFVRESQRLNAQMVLLTIAIAGGPFLGLLGTVVGVMITFAAIAAAGDVNVNAIAPGIAAALVATVAGLGVAIPALFGYNYLASKIKDVASDMQVFVDEFITKIAENYSE